MGHRNEGGLSLKTAAAMKRDYQNAQEAELQKAVAVARRYRDESEERLEVAVAAQPGGQPGARLHLQNLG
jgi:hypothetical protein